MSTELANDEVFCRDCGEVINERAEICPECGIRQKDTEPQGGGDKDSGIAAVASFLVPGLGQVYNGQIAKGIIAGVITIGLAITVVGLIIAAPIWLWLVYDAYKVAEGGGAGASTSGGSPGSPRLNIARLLNWYEDRADDPEEFERVRERFRKMKGANVGDGDAEYIMQAVEEYELENPGERLTSVRDALGR